jgi:hypothetical protein
MKAMRMKLISLFLLPGLLGILTSVNSQDYKPTKKEKKEAKNAMMTANFYELDSLLVSRQFVLEADYLQNKIGDLAPVSSTLNFVKVDGEKGTLQTGSDLIAGHNGVGGVTTEGNISSYKINRTMKSLNHRVTFNLVSNLGIFNIDMNVRADNSASATITSTTSGLLTWRGHLASLSNTRIFKGPDTY